MGLFNHLGESVSEETQVAGITNFDIVLSNYARVDQLEKYLHRSKKQNNEMKTDLNMSDNRITNLPNPKNAADAVSRKYVNDRLKIFLRNKNLDNIPEQFTTLEKRINKKFVSQETELLNLSKAIQQNRQKMVEINQELENEIELLNVAKRELEEADEGIKDDLVLELGNKINEGFNRIQKRIATIRNTMVDNNEIQDKINEVSILLQERLTLLSNDIVNIRDTLSNNNISTQASIQKLTEDFKNLQDNLIQIQADIVEIHNNEVERYNNDITLLETKITNLETKDDELQTQIDELKTELDTSETEIDRKIRRKINRDFDDVKDELNTVKVEINDELTAVKQEVEEKLNFPRFSFNVLYQHKKTKERFITIESRPELFGGSKHRLQRPYNFIEGRNNYTDFYNMFDYEEAFEFANVRFNINTFKVIYSGLYTITMSIKHESNPPFHVFYFTFGEESYRFVDNQERFTLFLKKDDEIRFFPVPTSNVTTMKITEAEIVIININ